MVRIFFFFPNEIRQSYKIDNRPVITDEDVQLLLENPKRYIWKIPVDLIPRVLPGWSEQFFRDRALLYDFVEYLYNYWRNFLRIILCNSEGNRFDQRPYHTFNSTVETPSPCSERQHLPRLTG